MNWLNLFKEGGDDAYAWIDIQDGDERTHADVQGVSVEGTTVTVRLKDPIRRDVCTWKPTHRESFTFDCASSRIEQIAIGVVCVTNSADKMALLMTSTDRSRRTKALAMKR